MVVAAPDGQLTTLNRKTGRTVSIAPPGFAAPAALTLLGDRADVSREGTGVVVLNPAGQVEFRVEGGTMPARAGQSILAPAGRGIVRFPLH